jgi:hypothetical protein
MEDMSTSTGDIDEGWKSTTKSTEKSTTEISEERKSKEED